MPPPDGEPIELPRSSEAVTWIDAEGGTLQLEPDGTFTGRDLCGDGEGATRNEPTSGTGTWEESARNRQSTVEVWFEGQDVSYSYGAVQGGAALKLWTFVGDPDQGLQCILTRQHD